MIRLTSTKVVCSLLLLLLVLYSLALQGCSSARGEGRPGCPTLIGEVDGVKVYQLNRGFTSIFVVVGPNGAVGISTQ